MEYTDTRDVGDEEVRVVGKCQHLEYGVNGGDRKSNLRWIMLAHYNIREWSQIKIRRMGSEAILDRTFFINISDRKPQAGRNQTYRESRERTIKYMQMHDSTVHTMMWCTFHSIVLNDGNIGTLPAQPRSISLSWNFFSNFGNSMTKFSFESTSNIQL